MQDTLNNIQAEIRGVRKDVTELKATKQELNDFKRETNEVAKEQNIKVIISKMQQCNFKEQNDTEELMKIS